jgi:bifunctional ADP-heptose synthase (sugar kinase/adenylyltransferase)
VLQARACGDVLVVGLIPDEEIIKVKGPPVMNTEERYVPCSLTNLDTLTLDGHHHHLPGSCRRDAGRAG